MKFPAPFIVLLFLAWSGFSQHPLVGAWEMVSIKGVDAEGRQFFIDTTTTRETKIITPTHYMLIAQDVQGDSLVFNRCYGGEVRVEGKKYIEIPTHASVRIFENLHADYSWRLDGDRFIQSGTVKRPDGKTVVLEEMIFRRVKSPQAYPDNPAIGTWALLSSASTDPSGEKERYDNKVISRLHIITPSHWMRITYRNNKFDSAMGGPYTLSNGKVYPVTTYGSVPNASGMKVEVVDKVSGNKLSSKGSGRMPDGSAFFFEEVYRRVSREP